MLRERVLCKQVEENLGNEITVAGWVRQVRRVSRNLAFWVLHDRSGWVQAVLSGTLGEAKEPSPESVVRIRGKVVKSPAQQGYEIQAIDCEVLTAAAPLPFELHHPELKAGSELLYDHRVLSLRHARVQAIFRIKAVALEAFREYLRKEGFLEVQTPKILATGTEGGAELFPLQYFERQAFLAQSPQFYKQMLVAAGFERVFEVGPVFRAESHDTSRHTNEFTSLDLEMGFIEDEENLMELETGLLQHIFATVNRRCAPDLVTLGATFPEIDSIPRLPVAEASALLLAQYGHQTPEGNLDPLGERLLCQYAEGHWGLPLVFVTDYPTSVRPFYAAKNPSDPLLTRSFDLLFRGLEITTGGLRIHHKEELLLAMEERGLKPAEYGFYLEAFNHGIPPHGGLAIGLERLVSRMLNLDNVRSATLFPRDRNRLIP